MNELTQRDTWDEGEMRPAVKSPRAVVSVAFTREDFEQIAEFARKQDMKTSEFIRRAALDNIIPKRLETIVISVSGGVRTGFPSAGTSQARASVTTSPAPPVFATA